MGERHSRNKSCSFCGELDTGHHRFYGCKEEVEFVKEDEFATKWLKKTWWLSRPGQLRKTCSWKVSTTRDQKSKTAEGAGASFLGTFPFSYLASRCKNHYVRRPALARHGTQMGRSLEAGSRMPRFCMCRRCSNYGFRPTWHQCGFMGLLPLSCGGQANSTQSRANCSYPHQADVCR